MNDVYEDHFRELFENHGKYIHDWDDVQRLMKNYGADGMVTDERMRQILRFYFDVYVINDPNTKIPRLLKSESRWSEILVENRTEQNPCK